MTAYPCRNCVYFNTCGENMRTEPCEGRRTKSEQTEEQKLQKDTLMQRLLDAGVSLEEMDHHESDLYVPKNTVTTTVIEKWCIDKGLYKKAFVDTFTDQITGKKMYDIAFAYDPFWENVARIGENHGSC